MALPKLTEQQRADALARATAARRRRAEVKSNLKARKIKVSAVLAMADDDEAIAKMRAQALLESLPRIGPQRAAVQMAQIGIAPTRRLRGLGPKQRKALIDQFG